MWLREAKNQPLVLVFEDLHWIDSETQEFLNEFLEKVPASQILMLFNYRPEYRHPWGSKTFFDQLRLDALPAESAEELLTGLLGRDADLAPLKQMLVRRGNPFFLEETVRTLIETGTLIGDRGDFRLVKPIETLQIPPTVQSMLAARIDRLEADDKRLLQTAAVIGKDVAFVLLKAISDLDEEQLTFALARLQASEFVYEAGLFPDLEYTFKHALTHEVAYAGLTQERKRHLHARIVDAIEHTYASRIDEHIERLAHHALRGEVWETSVNYLRRAGQRAFARSAYAEAVNWWEQALKATKNLPDGQSITNQEIDIRLELRGPLFALGKLEKTMEHISVAQQLAEREGDHYRTALALAYQVQARLFTCDVSKALSVGQRALLIAEEQNYTDVRVIAGLYLPHMLQAQGAPREAEAQQRANIESLSAVPENERFNMPALPVTYEYGMYAQMAADFGNFSQAEELLQRASDSAQRVSLPYGQAYVYFSTCMVQWIKGEFGEAIAAGEEGMRICDANGINMFRVWVAMNLAMSYAKADRASEAVKLFDDTLPQFDEMGIVYGRLIALPLLANAYLADGELPASLKAADDAIRIQAKNSTNLQRPMTLEVLGRIHSHPSYFKPEQAETYFRQARESAELQGSRVNIAHSHAGVGRLHARLNNRAVAREELTRASNMYREMEMNVYLGQTQEDLADLG